MNISEWFEQDLAKSGISLKMAADLGIALVDKQEIYFIIGFMPNTSGKPIQGYKIIFRKPDGSPMLTPDGSPYIRVRLQYPHFDSEGEAVKYLSPISSGICPYIIPPVHRFLMDNPTHPAMMTEGEKKSICGWNRSRMPVMGLCGIWGWMESKKFRDELGEPDLINADIAAYLNGKRNAVIIFDSDCIESDKTADFDLCASRFARELRIKFNTQLLRINIPPDISGQKVGLDDYLMKNRNSLIPGVLP